MRSFFSPRQLAHAPVQELHNGAFVPFSESGARVGSVLAAIGTPEPALDFGEAALLGVHSADYLDFLKAAWNDWRSAGRPGDAAGYVWPVVRRRKLALDRIDARLGQYSYAPATQPAMSGRWSGGASSRSTGSTPGSASTATTLRARSPRAPGKARIGRRRPR
jgi:acetoin utilization deacetylase AcuC-like enzyme